MPSFQCYDCNTVSVQPGSTNACRSCNSTNVRSLSVKEVDKAFKEVTKRMEKAAKKSRPKFT